MKFFRKAMTALAFGVGGALMLAVLPAGASGNPGRQPVPFPGDFTVPWCGDAVGPVLVHTVVENQYMKTFTKPDGTIEFAFNGHLVQAYSANGKTVTLNISGPGRFIIHPDGSIVGVGGGLSTVGNPTGLWLYSGHLVISPDGTVISHTGHTTDICALLMP